MKYSPLLWILFMDCQKKVCDSYKTKLTPFLGPLSIANTEKLKFYSLYKQGTDGPCNKPKPPFWQPIEKLKW